MKPRQTMKNYHNSNVPPHHQGGGSAAQNLSTPLPPALRDIDLVKLGLNLEDMPNLQVPSSNSSSSLLPNSQDEAVKCLQAIYGGVGASGSSTSNNNTSVGVGEAGFNPITNNTHGGIGGQNKQELQHQFINSQQHSSSQLGQHFRSVSASNMPHSSQQQHHQPPTLPPSQQQQKSVLSLQHQLQNDLSNRRLNHHHQHHHQHDPHTNSSLANLNSVNAMPNSTSDSNSASALIGGAGVGGSISGKISHVSNLMDTLGGMEHLLFDNSMINNKDSTSSNQQQSMLRHQQLQKLLKATGSQQKPSSSSVSHRSDTTQSQRNIASTSNMLQHHLSSSTPASAISPPQTTAFSSVPKSLLNLAACSSSSAPSTGNSSLASVSKFSSMVSQLNMISGRSPASNISNAKSSSKINNGVGSQDSLKSNLRSSNVNESGLSKLLSSSAVTTSSQNVVSTRSNSKQQQQLQLSLLSDDQSSTANRTNFRNAYNVPTTGNISKLPTAPVSHIQKNNPSSSNSSSNNNNSSTSKEAFLANLQERAARVGVSIGEINKPVQVNLAGSVNNLPNSNIMAPANTNTTVNIASNTSKEDFNINTVDRKEIESALSRVEARNDLSLLYPPMLLASNSQKQINALSAGFHGSEDSDIFTKEVKKIVLEECNIIYECKECNNLFRSLANLVKHKRTYCLEQSSERNSLEMNKRPCANAILPLDQRTSSITLTNNNSLSAHLGGDSSNNNSTSNEVHNIEQDLNNVTMILGGGGGGGGGTSTSNASLIRGVDAELTTSSIDMNNDSNYQTMRQPSSADKRNLSNMLRMFQSQERKNREKEIANLQQRANNPVSISQSNLSELLQSQPKQHRLPVARDGGSALLGALSMPPVSTHDNNNLYSAFDSDKNNISCTPSDVQEELVRNSSLAKTLLSEKVRIANPRQSLIELSKVETMQQKTTYNSNSNVKRAPKRKFLEDCIQKVKRDKFHTEDDEDPQLQLNSLALNPDITLSKITKDQDKDRVANQDMGCLVGGDSDVDSDILMIDLDEPRKKSPIKKGKRRMSTAASSTTSSSNSSLCRGMNTSSALLKALTRPVDPKRSYNSASTSMLADDRSSSNLSKKLQTQQPQPREKEPEVVVQQEQQQQQQQHIEEVVVVFEKQTCDICDVDYKNLDALIEHIVEKHTEEKMVYPCIFCSFSFITLENVCRHILDIHQKPMAQVQRLKEVVRSRSYLSSDFLGCSDHPAVTSTVQEKEATSDMDVEKPASQTPKKVAVADEDKVEVEVTSPELCKKGDREQDEIKEGELVIDGADGEGPKNVEAEPNYDDNKVLDIQSAKSPPSRRNTEEQSCLSEQTTNPDDDDEEELEKVAVSNGDEESMDMYEEVSVDEEEDVSGSDEKGEEDDEEEEDDDDDDDDEDDDDDCSSDKQVDKELGEPGASVEDDDDSGDSADKVQNSIGYFEDSEDERQEVKSRKNDLADDDEVSPREESDLIQNAASSTNQLDEVPGEDSLEELGTSSSSSAATTNHNHHHHHHHHHQSIKGDDLTQQHNKDLKLSPTTKGNTGAGGGGGIMKLRIQLKTRPDDKGKVYEIV